MGRDGAEQRWASERTAPMPSQPRQRARYLPADAADEAVLAHNHWDDAEVDAAAAKAAEAMIGSQSFAPANRVDECRQLAAGRDAGGAVGAQSPAMRTEGAR